jgi:hypothetical protein
MIIRVVRGSFGEVETGILLTRALNERVLREMR